MLILIIEKSTEKDRKNPSYIFTIFACYSSVF